MDIYTMIKIGGIYNSAFLIFYALLLIIALFRLARVIEQLISSSCRRITSIAMFTLLILACFRYTNPLIRIWLV
jgi:hypothetical protein